MKRLPPKYHIAIFLTLAIALAAAGLASATHDIPAWLTQVMGAPQAPTYTMYYATSCPPGEPGCTADELVPNTDSDGDGFPDAVELMSSYLEGSRTTFMSTFGMNEPYFNGAPSRPAYMSGGCWGSYNTHTMWICAGGTSADWVQAKSTAVHELFHGVQWAYPGSGPQPGWVIEGQAAFVEDETFADLDAEAGTYLFSQGNGYLADPNGQAITATGYPAGWFWKYFAEQYGTAPNPGTGMDVIRRFWQLSVAHGTAGIDAVNRVLAEVRLGTTFEDVFKDFVVANYARKLSDPALPAKYRFADEGEAAPGSLNVVKLDIDQALGGSDQVGPLVTGVLPWGVRYYSVSPSSSVPIISINVHQDTSQRAFYSLLAIRDGQLVSEERLTGRHFARALVNDSYDKVVLIVAGLERNVNYRLTINGQQPVLNIVDPLQARPALVTAGLPAVRDTFLVKVEVLDATAQPVLGIDPSAISLRVGASNVPASDIITSAYLQGQYWLLVRAPALPVNVYDLRVQWSALSDTESRAVSYATRATTDNVLVVDRSGSMLDANKLTAAKNAGRLYIDSWPDGDYVSVVSFSDDASVDFDLMLLNSTSRGNARTAVNNLLGGGGTSIGDGATTAMNELAENNSVNRWAIVLLSDGMETSPSSINDFLGAYYARRDADPPEKIPVVHTVALGPDADRPAMERIARETGGTFQYATEPGTALQPGAVDAILSLDLAEIYRSIAEAVDPQQQIYAAQVTIDPQTATLDVPILVDGAAAVGVFSVNWEDALTPALIRLYDPDGIQVTSGLFSDSTHRVWRITNPKTGAWHITFDCGGVEFCAETYFVEAALKSPLGINLYFNPEAEQRFIGVPVDVVVSLADQLPVLGASINAQITAPTGAIHNLALYDDGEHQDGGADDGLYGNRFRQTYAAGSYVSRVTASGLSNLGSPIVRRIQRAFDVAADSDKDQDGLPDHWEETNGTNPFISDSQKDPDQDGLSNLSEYNNGTDPLDPDSDDGGESDGSEVTNKKDPLDPKDDGVKITGELYIEPGKGLNIITYPTLPGIVNWSLYFSTNPDQGYSLLNGQAPLTGVFTHTNLTNGLPYWYYLVGTGSGGARSAPSSVVQATPSEDPLPPGGSILINDGAAFTNLLDVSLSLQAENDAPPHTPIERAATLYEDGRNSTQTGVEMRLSNDPAFSGADWEPFSPTRAWQLDGWGGPAVVYAQFRDGNGNLSPIVSDAIDVAQRLWMPLIRR
jgi:hypothetical protein